VRAVTPEPDTKARTHEFDEFDRELFLALQRDGRLSCRDVAAAVGESESMVRRRIGLSTRSGLPAFRTDFARVEAGWLTGVALKLGVSGSPLAAVGRALVHYPETRFCVATVGAGAPNLFVTMQLHKAVISGRGGFAVDRRAPGRDSAAHTRRAALGQVLGAATGTRRSRR
jgi:DNA-binding Lrp family transcriptional regulator